jgi:recombination protein RecA
MIIKATSEQLAALDLAVKGMNKEYGQILLQKLGKQAYQKLPSVPTGLRSLDEHVIVCGGLPDGRVIEIFGPESSGKTTLALQFIAQTQKLGGLAAFVDAEHALDPGFARILGVDVENLLVSQPDYGEQALEVVRSLVETAAVKIIVIDSVSALVPKAELEGDFGDSNMGLHARLMSQAMRILTAMAMKNGVTLVFINQIREKVGVSFGNPEVTTGGRALKFFASVRLEVRRLSKTDGGEIKDGDTHIGHKMKITAKKNKVGPPFRSSIVSLYYASGFDVKLDTVDYAIQQGVVVEGSKGWFTLGDEKVRKEALTQPGALSKIEKLLEGK